MSSLERVDCIFQLTLVNNVIDSRLRHSQNDELMANLATLQCRTQCRTATFTETRSYTMRCVAILDSQNGVGLITFPPLM